MEVFYSHMYFFIITMSHISIILLFLSVPGSLALYLTHPPFTLLKKPPTYIL